MRLYLGGYLDFFSDQPDNWMTVELVEPTPLLQVVLNLEIPVGDIQLVVVNGQLGELNEVVVSELDEVKIFSAIGGG